MIKKKSKLNNKGQALIETVMVVTGVTIILFATIQICIIVVDQLICNEAAFQVARSLTVCEIKGKDERKVLPKQAALVVVPILGLQLSLNNLQFVPTGIDFKKNPNSLGIDNENMNITAYNIDLHYLVNTMVIKLIDPLSQSSYSYNGINLLKQYVRARMVKSPDETYYRKAYKDAQPF
jgi:hypothetical protein